MYIPFSKSLIKPRKQKIIKYLISFFNFFVSLSLSRVTGGSWLSREASPGRFLSVWKQVSTHRVDRRVVGRWKKKSQRVSFAASLSLSRGNLELRGFTSKSLSWGTSNHTLVNNASDLSTRLAFIRFPKLSEKLGFRVSIRSNWKLIRVGFPWIWV